MARDPDARPLDAAEFGDELRAIQARNGYDVDEMALLMEQPMGSIGRRGVASAGYGEKCTDPSAIPPTRVGNLPWS